MPEAATVEAPAPAAAPAASPETISTTGGIAEFTQSMANFVKSKEAPAAPEKPAAQPKEVKAEVKEAPAVTLKEGEKPAPTTAKEKSLAEMSGEELDAVMKKAPAKAWKIYDYAKQKYEARIAEYEAKVKAIEQKPVETAADAKKVEAYEKQIKELQEQNSNHLKTLAELDYSKSPEFRERFTEPLTRAYQAAIEEITQLTVQEGESSRAATQHDFDLLMRLPLKEQVARAKTMFGDMADVFFSRRNEIQRLQNEGRQALQKAQADAESNRTKAELRDKEQQSLYDSQLEIEQKDLASKLPDMFGDTDNQQAAEAQTKGREFAKKALANRSSMTPQDRAAHDAALIETHAYARRAVVEIKALETEVETLKAELAKYRKTDPGAELDGKAPSAKPSDELENKGINAVAASFKRAA